MEEKVMIDPSVNCIDPRTTEARIALFHGLFEDDWQLPVTLRSGAEPQDAPDPEARIYLF